jgi:hypothetical protein
MLLMPSTPLIMKLPPKQGSSSAEQMNGKRRKSDRWTEHLRERVKPWLASPPARASSAPLPSFRAGLCQPSLRAWR